MDHRAVFSRESDFTSLHPLSLQNTFEVTGKKLSPVCIGNKTAKGFIGQQSPLYSQQLRTGKIYLPYHSARIKGEIADGRKVIEFGILVPRQLKLLPGPEQLVVLHLQLDLVNLKFLDEPLGRLPGPGKIFPCCFRSQLLFSAAEQFCSIS